MYCASRAGSCVRRPSLVRQVREGVHRVAASVVGRAVVARLVAEAVERASEAHDAAGVEPEQLVEERGHAPGPGRLVVLDDVAVLALFLEEVEDERLGLERDEVVDRRRDEEHVPRVSGSGRSRHRLDARAREAELQLALERARARTRSAGKEERVVPVLDEDAGVGLEHVLVEPVLDASVDAIGAQVVHEEGKNGVGEEVLAGAVRRGRQLRPLERETEDHRVEVGEVRRDEDERPLLRQRTDGADGALDEDAPVERAQIERAAEAPERLQGRHHQADERRRGARGEPVDARIEVARHVGRVPAHDVGQALAALGVGHAADRSRERSPRVEPDEVVRSAGLQPLGLEEGGLVQREQGIAHVVAHAADDLVDDRAALLVEVEDRRDRRGGRGSTSARSCSRLAHGSRCSTARAGRMQTARPTVTRGQAARTRALLIRSGRPARA